MTRRFTLIGPGRAGLSLHTVLGELGWECVAVCRRGDDIAHAARDVDLCVIATPDAEISAVASAIEPGHGVVMHLSGATPLSALGNHNEVAGLHPLQSLPNPTLGAASLYECHFAVAGHRVAKQLAEAISGKWFPLSDSDRALYHCAAAIASNHTVALLGQVQRLADSVGVPMEAFAPLVQASVANALAEGPGNALTGPAARGDHVTIEAHRDALAAKHPDELASYDALVELAQRLSS